MDETFNMYLWEHDSTLPLTYDETVIATAEVKDTHGANIVVQHPDRYPNVAMLLAGLECDEIPDGPALALPQYVLSSGKPQPDGLVPLWTAEITPMGKDNDAMFMSKAGAYLSEDAIRGIVSILRMIGRAMLNATANGD